MATFPLNKANCNFPGAGGYDFTYYGAHPYEVMRGWRPTGWDTTGFQMKGLVVWSHGGLGLNQGNQGLNLTSSTTWVKPMHETHGWPVVAVDFPPVEQNSDHKRTPCSARLWPAHVFSVARAIQYLKANWNSEELWGKNTAGVVNTIDPAKIVVGGFSYGGTLAMLLSVIPTSRLPRTGDLFLGRIHSPYSADHLPRAVVYDQAQVDWTQFSFNPTQTIGTYKSNTHQVFTWDEEDVFFGDTYLSPGQITVVANKVPIEWKKAASPWWWLVQGFPEARRVAHVGVWPKNASTDPAQQNLTWQDWNPGTQRLAEDLGKAWYDPHLHFQAKPFGDKLTELDIQNSVIWGNATTNPAPGLNRDAIPDPDGYIVNFLTVTLGL